MGEHKVRPYFKLKTQEPGGFHLLDASEGRTIKHFITSTIHPSTFPLPSTQNFKLQTSNFKLKTQEPEAQNSELRTQYS
jgi:hypothetical protein